MKDSLGDRMKEQYEDRSRFYLPRRSYTIVRLDGKAFHTFTRGMTKPFDDRFMAAMAVATKSLCEEAQGAQFGYTQSDEISILLTDFAEPNTEAWFNNNLQKICSVSASTVTHAFNQFYGDDKRALFDSRVFSIADEIEVENYFIWRQKDWNRNSIQMLAQANFSHKELQGKNTSDLHEMLHEKGINWAELSLPEKNGYLAYKTEEGWEVEGAFTFTGTDREKLSALIPKRWKTDLTNQPRG